jgi:hypothetical protein
MIVLALVVAVAAVVDGLGEFLVRTVREGLMLPGNSRGL